MEEEDKAPQRTMSDESSGRPTPDVGLGQHSPVSRLISSMPSVSDDAVATDKPNTDDDIEKLDATNKSWALNPPDTDETVVLMTESQKAREEGTKLPENIYSILYVSEPFCFSFFFAFFIFWFQTTMLVLVLADLITITKDNPLGIPPDVSNIVRAAQGLSLLLAVVVGEDMKEAVRMLHCGYDKSILKKSRHASMPKWILAYLGQFCVGVLLNAVIFILVVRSSSVIDIFLNFAALAFLSEIDDVVFRLGRDGYITESVRSVCDKVQEHRAPVDNKSFRARRAVLLVAMLSFFGGFAFIISQQYRGTFVCESLLVQFEDDYIDVLPAFSGAYTLVRDSRYKDGRRAYKSRDNGKHLASYFRYCKSEGAWVFAAQLPESGIQNQTEPDITLHNACSFWLLRSPKTKTFDINTIASSTWLTKTKWTNAKWTKKSSEKKTPLLQNVSDLVLPVGHLFLECNDCSNVNCQGTCDGQNECKCNHTSFGDRCEFDSPCQMIEVDEATLNFTDQGLVFSSKFIILRRNGTMQPVRAYGRPVYYFNWGEGIFDVILFNGRRWLLHDTYTLRTTNRSLLEEELSGFHAAYGDYRKPYFISDPLDLGTPSNAITPSGLDWYPVGRFNLLFSFEVGRSIDTNLVCASCDDFANPCDNQGLCKGDGTCDCRPELSIEFKDAFSGPFCRMPMDAFCGDQDNAVKCRNGGTCVDQKCNCTEGFSGAFCLVTDKCEAFGGNHVCFNGGNCSNSIDSYCACPTGFSGPFCQDAF